MTHTAPHSATPLSRGIHHLALTTEDMKMTTEFYVDVLGMPLIHAMKVPAGLGTGPKNRGNPPYEEIRHYFFDMGADGLVAFFEIPKGEEPQANRNAIGGMQHVAFTVTKSRFDDIVARLEKHEIANSGPIVQLPGLLGVYFYDPNGIRLEFSCQPADGEAPGVMELLTQTKGEAAVELATLDGADDAWITRYTEQLPESRG